MPEVAPWAVAVVLPSVCWEREDTAAVGEPLPGVVEQAVHRLNRVFPGAEIVVGGPLWVDQGRSDAIAYYMRAARTANARRRECVGQLVLSVGE